MDKTLIDYDKNLEELERQREKLEIVMQMMGQEWEESGAGIGWLGQLDLPETNAQLIPAYDKLTNITAELGTVAMETNAAASDELLSTALFSQTTGSSPDYLQSLLNVNEALLAQSLANTTTTATATTTNTNTTVYQPSTPMLTPVEEHCEILLDTKLHSPMIVTPQQDDEDVHNTPRDYLGAMNPESEMIFSSLMTNKKSTIYP